MEEPMITVQKKRSTQTPYRVKEQARYMELICKFPLRPIRSDADLDAATEMIHHLIDQPKLTRPELDYLDVLDYLVETYEDAAYPMGPVSDAAMLRSLIESKGVSQSQVAIDTGIAESTISEILAGKRKLNRGQIGKLARYFHVDPGVFTFGE